MISFLSFAIGNS